MASVGIAAAQQPTDRTIVSIDDRAAAYRQGAVRTRRSLEYFPLGGP